MFLYTQHHADCAGVDQPNSSKVDDDLVGAGIELLEQDEPESHRGGKIQYAGDLD
ncbi:hypothetical protein GCM10009835_14640 [Planosporangium flavigriseum]